MKTPDDIRDELFAIAEPLCNEEGYELVDIRYLREQSGWVVRAFIDRLGGRSGGISFADCERISRELSAVLDVEDPIPHAYNLEVSSPGVDRPLRTASHFRRFVGHTARVLLTEAQDGRKRFKGRIEAVAPEAYDDADDGDDDAPDDAPEDAERDPGGGSAPGEAAVTIRVDDGQSFSLRIADIASAKLVPDWDALEHHAGGGPEGGDAENGAPPGAA